MRFEKLPEFCFGCGRIRHLARECHDTEATNKDKLEYGTWLKRDSIHRYRAAIKKGVAGREQGGDKADNHAKRAGMRERSEHKTSETGKGPHRAEQGRREEPWPEKMEGRLPEEPRKTTRITTKSNNREETDTIMEEQSPRHTDTVVVDKGKKIQTEKEEPTKKDKYKAKEVGIHIREEVGQVVGPRHYGHIIGLGQQNNEGQKSRISTQDMEDALQKHKLEIEMLNKNKNSEDAQNLKKY